MQIPYLKNSLLVGLCENVLAARGNQLDSGIDIQLEPTDRDTSILVTVEKAATNTFEADWDMSAPTSFPVQINAAATALFKQGVVGTFLVSQKQGMLTIRRSDNWSSVELKASVEAYVEMLQKHHLGQKVVKTHYYEYLANRFGRTAKSFEFRMQNISYVYLMLGRQWLPGLKPASHVGATIAALIEELLAEIECRPMAPVVGFEIKVKELTGKSIAKPRGNTTPSAKLTTTTQFNRDPAVKAWVLQHARGICECCQQPAPFFTSDGMPFLEVHHVRGLADGGSDTVENTVAICPNCHRELHYGVNSPVLVETMYKNVLRLVKE